MRRSLIGAAALAVALCACASPSAKATSAADTITKSVLANDANGVRNAMDAQQQADVTRASVGTLSDVMHKLGDYRGLTLTKSDTGKNVFTFRADFSKGAMVVEVRMDPDGKVAAYRATPAS